MSIRYGLILLIAFSNLFSLAQANDVIIATEEWDKHTNKDGSGYYFDLLNTIYNRNNVNVNVNIKFVPFARSIVMVNNGNADLMLGA